jgi:hypothetical protein
LRVVSKTISSSSSSGSAGLVAGQAGPVAELITKVVGAEISAGAELGVVTKVDGQVLSIVAGAELVSGAGAQLVADIAGAESTALAKGTKFDSGVGGTQLVAGAEVDAVVTNVDDAEPLSNKAGAAQFSNAAGGDLVANTAGAEVKLRSNCSISSSSCFFFKAACNCLRFDSKTISSSRSSGLVAGMAGPVAELITKVVGAEMTAGAELGVVTKVDGQVLSIVASAELVSGA